MSLQVSVRKFKGVQGYLDLVILYCNMITFFNTLKNHIKEFQAPELDNIFDEQVKGNFLKRNFPS